MPWLPTIRHTATHRNTPQHAITHRNTGPPTRGIAATVAILPDIPATQLRGLCRKHVVPMQDNGYRRRNDAQPAGTDTGFWPSLSCFRRC